MSTWYVDYGCSKHMTSNKEVLFEYEEKIGGGSVTFGDNRKGQIKGDGIIVRGDVDINQVAYVNGQKHKLISVSSVTMVWM